MKKSHAAMVMLFAIVTFTFAHAADMTCRLKGGSLVPLPAEACAKEGGAVVVVPDAKGVTPASAPAATYQLSADPRLAAAQKAVLDVLNKPVVDTSGHKSDPEGLDREAKFTECTLKVEENLRLDYGNLLSARKNFKISSTVDFRNILRDEFGVLGEIASKGAYLKAHAVYLGQAKRRGGNDIAISVSDLYRGNYRKFTMPESAPYWETARDDFWMADEFGYARAYSMGSVATDKVRILFIVNSAGDAAALNKAFDEVHAACRPQQ